MNKKVTKKLFFLFNLFLLISCGPSIQEKQNIAIVTCNIMAESRNMDAATKIREINAAREKINEAPYLLGGKEIQESFKYGLCTNLVLNDPEYQNILFQLKEVERLAKEKAAEEARIIREKLAEEARIKREKAAEEARIARLINQKEARAIEREEARIAKEKEEKARIAREKAAEEARIKREKAVEAAKKKYATAIMEKRYIDSFDPLDLYSKLKIQNIVLEKKSFGGDSGSMHNIAITLNKIQCLKLSDLNVEIKMYSINGDLIEPISTNYSNMSAFFSEEGCKNNYHGWLYISESDYIKLKNIKVEDKIEKDIDLFSEISLKVTRGSYLHCKESKRKLSMIGLCPQDYPPLKNGEPWVNLSTYFKKYKWINE